MRSGAVKLEVTHWPYGIEVEAVNGGLMLRPKLKARAGWIRKFSKPAVQSDEFAELRNIGNRFDDTEWEW